MSMTRRLLPSLCFVTVGCALCYLYSQYWIPPARADRWWPNTSLSWATIFGIAATNVLVFALWRAFPPAWRFLNRYFVIVTATPSSFSMLGSTFSHQQVLHIAVNMGFLLFIPVAATLHEEVGRGTFLAIYIASGLVASFAPFAYWTLRGRLTMTSLGASGAIIGVLAAYCTLHMDRTFSLWIIPTSWQEWVQLKGWVILIVIFTTEIAGLVSRKKKIDHLSHLGGFCTGFVSGWWLKTKKADKRAQEVRELIWYERLIGKRPTP